MSWTVVPAYVDVAARLMLATFTDVEIDGPEREGPSAADRGHPAGDPYVVLHLREIAPPELIVAAHKCLARLHHPDKGGSHEAMLAINAAVETIRRTSCGMAPVPQCGLENAGAGHPARHSLIDARLIGYRGGFAMITSALDHHQRRNQDALAEIRGLRKQLRDAAVDLEVGIRTARPIADPTGHAIVSDVERGAA